MTAASNANVNELVVTIRMYMCMYACVCKYSFVCMCVICNVSPLGLLSDRKYLKKGRCSYPKMCNICNPFGEL